MQKCLPIKGYMRGTWDTLEVYKQNIEKLSIKGTSEVQATYMGCAGLQNIERGMFIYEGLFFQTLIVIVEAEHKDQEY